MSTNQENEQNQMSASAQPAASAMQNTQTTQSAPQSAQANVADQQPKAVVGVFRDLAAAQQAVAQLRSSGFTTEEINLCLLYTSDVYKRQILAL